MTLLDFIHHGFGAGLAVLAFSGPAAIGFAFIRVCWRASK